MNEQLIFFTYSEKETLDLGRKIIKLYPNVRLFILEGDFGVGKTILVKGFAKALNVNGNIKSPSFNLKNVYPNFIHYDLYNCEKEILHKLSYELFEELEYNVVAIEWGNKFLLKKYLKKIENFLEIKILLINKNERKVIIRLVE